LQRTRNKRFHAVETDRYNQYSGVPKRLSISRMRREHGQRTLRIRYMKCYNGQSQRTSYHVIFRWREFRWNQTSIGHK